jgi:lipid II:glycine glycyltransferase (peptidoglycan interpeptide bridge formation enzyme)
VETFKRSNLPFMNYESLKRFVLGLGENGKMLIAERQGVLESCVIYGFSSYCAYAIYGGNRADMVEGANKLLHWEAVRLFKNLGIQRYDFVGARIDPEKGSKEEAINSFKRRLGGKLKQGYMWKYSLRPVKSLAYSLGVRFLRGGDIVDRERHKMKSSRDLATDSSEACNGG